MLTIPPRESWFKQYQITFLALGGFAFFLLLCLAVWHLFYASKNYNYEIAVVEKGDVVASVSGYGRLLPRESLSLISEVEGILTEQHIYPGSWINAGETILTLRNIQLERAKETAEFSLIEAQADFQTVESNLKREALKLANDILLAEKDIEMSHKELQAMNTLLAEDIISQLDFLKAETRYEQLLLQLSLLKNTQKELDQIRTIELQAAQSRLVRAERQLEIAQHDLELLSVKSPRSGLLAQLSDGLEIGKNIPRGEALAQITDPTSLYADILIPASDVNQIAVGQKAWIQIREDKVAASVMRIHPNAENNQVRLELNLLDNLPARARALIEVTATILIQQATDVTRVKTPAYITAGHQNLPLYFINQGKLTAQYVQVGVYSRDFIEIIEGAAFGDHIALERPNE